MIGKKVKLMLPIEIFLSMTKSPSKISILKLIYAHHLLSAEDFQTFYLNNKTAAMKDVWELYNENLVTTLTRSSALYFKLTSLGNELVLILKELESWIEQNQESGGF